MLEAGVPKATFYRLMDRDEEFRDKIDGFRQFVSVLVNSALITQLRAILQEQTANPGQKIAKDDVAFLQWFANNSNLTKGEFGDRKSIALTDPEAEIQKLMSSIDEKADPDEDE